MKRLSAYPSTQAIKALHRRYAKSNLVYRKVYGHCAITWEIARRLIGKRRDINRPLVRAGCLLHDIGTYQLYDRHGTVHGVYLTHGVRGAHILRREGLPEPLCRMAERHTGVGISKREIVRRKLPLPKKDFFAETKEERLVMYADSFHSKVPTFNSPAWYEQQIRKYGKGNAEKFRELKKEFGIPNLKRFAAQYRLPIR